MNENKKSIRQDDEFQRRLAALCKWVDVAAQDALIAHIDAHTKAQLSAARATVVPDGYMLVPITPTDEMVVAFAEEWYGRAQTFDDPQMDEAYAAMLAVAPAAPTQAAPTDDKQAEADKREREYFARWPDATQAAPRVSEQDERTLPMLDECKRTESGALILDYHTEQAVRAALNQGAQAAQGSGVQEWMVDRVIASAGGIAKLMEAGSESRAEKVVRDMLAYILAAHPAPSAAPAQPQWTSIHTALPPFDQGERVLVYTEGFDFAGQQFFDIKADELWETDPERQTEVSAAASHWMPRPYPGAAPSQVAPIPMILHCPQCGRQHVDAPDERTPDWSNPPHRSRLCHGCGHIWRPADVPTEGVASIQTRGSNDSPAPSQVAQIDSSAAEFLSERLARVARAVGYKMPEGDHAFIAGVAGTILGDIARKLETSHVTPATEFANDGKEPDWGAYAAAEAAQVAQGEPVADYHDMLRQVKEHLGVGNSMTIHGIARTVAAPVAPTHPGLPAGWELGNTSDGFIRLRLVDVCAAVVHEADEDPVAKTLYQLAKQLLEQNGDAA